VSLLTSSPITIQFREIDGLKIRYAESRQPRDAQALLLSPWPESLYSFEPMWEQLAEHAQLVAIDLPGFGHSEGREDLFSSRAMAEFVLKALDAFELDNPHTVGPDIGTSTLLFAAASQPTRLRSIVIGGGTAAVPLELGGPLADVVNAPDLEPLREMNPRDVVNSILVYHRDELPDYIREDFLSAYDGERLAESARFVRSYPTELPVLADLLPQIETPVQIIQGNRDTGVLPGNAQYLRDRLPNSKLDLLDANHFVWADRADDYAALVLNWWNDGYKRP
jgi:pimeloyl-ACP methyl ester carboxylesterase